MTNPEPVNTVNLDQYGEEALPWSAVAERLESETTSGQDVFTVLGTVMPDGRPHAAFVGAMWIDGAWYVVSGPGTRKARNLAHNAACTLTARLAGVDVVFVGQAYRVTAAKELERVAEVYRSGGWPAEVAGDAFTAPYTAPSGTPALEPLPDCVRTRLRGRLRPTAERRDEVDIPLRPFALPCSSCAAGNPVTVRSV